jgi:polar amino acid transport system substrate-binding protein
MDTLDLQAIAERGTMKRRCRKFAGILIVALLSATLGLGGCIGPSKGGSLSLPSAKITQPAIIQSGVLRVGVDSSHVPFAGLSDGKVIGIDVDIAAALAEELGLRLEVVDIREQDINTLLQDGAVDVIMGIQEEAASATAAATTTPVTFGGAEVGPYLVDAPAAFAPNYSGSTEGFTVDQLQGAIIGAQESSLSAWQVGQDFGDANLQTFPTLNAAFDALSSGQVSYVAADAIVGAFLAVKYDDVSCLGLLTDSQGVFMGVAADKTELATSLTEALRVVRDNGLLQVIIAKWLGPTSAETVASDKAIVSLTGSDSAATGGTADAADGAAAGADVATDAGGETDASSQ